MLLRAAETILAAEGPNALTVRHMAATAGVSTMNVYSRFGGKDVVVEHLYVEGFTRLAAAVEHAGRTDDPLADLRRAGTAYRRFALDHPTYYSIMFERAVPDFEPSESAAGVASATLAQLGALLERAMEAGVITRHDTMHAAAAVWATCHGLVSLELKSGAPPSIDWDEVYRIACDAMIDGFAAGVRADA